MSDFPCGVCGKTWSGHSRCHCASCHENFSSVTSFDKHRRDFVCRPPAECRLVLRDGYWGRPGERPSQEALASLSGTSREALDALAEAEPQ